MDAEGGFQPSGLSLTVNRAAGPGLLSDRSLNLAIQQTTIAATHQLDALVVRRELLEGQVHGRQRGGILLEGSSGVQQQWDRSGRHEGLDIIVRACAQKTETCASGVGDAQAVGEPWCSTHDQAGEKHKTRCSVHLFHVARNGEDARPLS